MKKRILLPVIFILTVLAAGFQSPDSQDPDERYFQQADSLLKLLTLEEKAGQMTNIGLTALVEGAFWTDTDSLVLDSAKMAQLLIGQHVGSVQNKGVYPPSKEEWHRLVKSVQQFVLANARHKIPVLFGMDGVHGANYTAGSTLFPQQIAMAATWNPGLTREMAAITAYELRASSLPWNYAPVLDVSWQPLWGRIFETFGEDTYLNTVLGKAFVEGSQGSTVSDTTRVAVCLKHFVGYGTPVSGKDRSPAYIPENQLRQYYLGPFREAIEQGALTVMINSGSVNGIPGHADHHLITNILKGELGLKGFVISDWQDVDRLAEVHRVARDAREAAKIAILAGIDMSMVPYDASFAEHVVDLVNDGEIPLSRIDDAVRRILFVKFKLGLFENPWHDPAGYTRFGSEAFAARSYEAALEAITLLKNHNQILPLKQRNLKILVTGPTADRLTALNGPWSRTWAGDDPSYDDQDKKTVVQALETVYGSQNVSYVMGTDYQGAVDSEQALLEQAAAADVIIVCVGEKPATEKPSDINYLELPHNQTELIRRLEQSGKPIVLVMLQGRPRIVREAEGMVDAILHAYWPGHEGGRALAAIIGGQANPSGKLPYTYPRFSTALQTYQHKGSDKLDTTFGMNAFNPQWEFGHGLSYTSFAFDELELSADTIANQQKLQVSVTVTNTGEYPGKEVVQLYVRDLVASITPDDRKLIGFEKITLEPGQRKTVTFEVVHRDLQFVGRDNQWIAEKGEFEILTGGNPDNLLKKTFYYSGLEAGPQNP